MGATELIMYYSSLLLAITVLALAHKSWKPQYSLIERETMLAIAHKDLSMLGDNESKLKYSLSNYLYSVLAWVYRRHGNAGSNRAMLVIRNWAKTGLSPLSKFDIEEPWTKFLLVVNEARENKVEFPIFNVSSEFNYHVLPKTLQFNDYVDCKTLIGKLDEMLGDFV